jgi:hypothetical protein
MNMKFLLFVLFLSVGFANSLYPTESSSDSPEFEIDSTVLFKSADSYEQVLDIWKTPEDINAWIAGNFSYDMVRALRLSETQRTKNSQLSIYHPAVFFTTKTGVCVDLSRFGVETLRHINPQSEPKYLMIEFYPIQIEGNTLRLHWMVSFKHDGMYYFFADSKRPGYIAGPYNDTREFIKEYAQYRSRKIVSFRELESYQKKRRTKRQKCQASPKSP